MALQTSGAISFQDINVELNLTPTAQISLDDAAVRKLLGKTYDTISMQDAYGKASTITYVNSSNIQDANIFNLFGSPTQSGDYVFINNGEISATTSAFALRTGELPAGSTLTIINNGYIRGKAGNGGTFDIAGSPGGHALMLEMSCSLENLGYIFGGGGGGGGIKRYASANSVLYIAAAGGGGAGYATATVYANGASVSSPYGVVATNTQPLTGDKNEPGGGGVVRATYNSTTYDDSVYGGSGGQLGQSGVLGSFLSKGTSGAYKNTTVLSVAGAGGNAILCNRYTLTQLNTSTADQIKGLIE